MKEVHKLEHPPRQAIFEALGKKSFKTGFKGNKASFPSFLYGPKEWNVGVHKAFEEILPRKGIIPALPREHYLKTEVGEPEFVLTSEKVLPVRPPEPVVRTVNGLLPATPLKSVRRSSGDAPPGKERSERRGCDVTQTHTYVQDVWKKIFQSLGFRCQKDKDNIDLTPQDSEVFISVELKMGSSLSDWVDALGKLIHHREILKKNGELRRIISMFLVHDHEIHQEILDVATTQNISVVSTTLDGKLILFNSVNEELLLKLLRPIIQERVVQAYAH
jgi:hypothetical protein